MIVVVRVAVPLEPLIVTATGSVPGLVGAVIVSVVVWPPETAVGLTLHVAVERPEHDELLGKVTVVFPNEPMGTTVIVVVPVPLLVVTAAGLAESTKSLVGFTSHSLTRL